MKDLLSDVWLERSILLKVSSVGFTNSLLTCLPLARSSLVVWACVLAATRIAAAMNDGIAQPSDAKRIRCRTIVSSPPSLDSVLTGLRRTPLLATNGQQF